MTTVAGLSMLPNLYQREHTPGDNNQMFVVETQRKQTH